MEQRKCKTCGITQNLEEFPFAGKVKDKKYYRHKCNKCYVKTKTTRKHNLRKKLIEYKKQLKCAHCGVSDHRVLQFHHKDNNKDFNVSDGVRLGVSFEKIIKEAEKCQVLCANCHLILHYEERK
jgi:NifB/MoaA-like Fe-S oxidoreductase